MLGHKWTKHHGIKGSWHYFIITPSKWQDLEFLWYNKSTASPCLPTYKGMYLSKEFQFFILTIFNPSSKNIRHGFRAMRCFTKFSTLWRVINNMCMWLTSAKPLTECLMHIFPIWILVHILHIRTLLVVYESYIYVIYRSFYERKQTQVYPYSSVITTLGEMKET